MAVSLLVETLKDEKAAHEAPSLLAEEKVAAEALVISGNRESFLSLDGDVHGGEEREYACAAALD